jgi:hypothetical protein
MPVTPSRHVVAKAKMEALREGGTDNRAQRASFQFSAFCFAPAPRSQLLAINGSAAE